MEPAQNLRPGFVRVKLHVVAHPVCREKSINAARLDPFLADHFIQQLLRIGKKFARLLAVFLVV